MDSFLVLWQGAGGLLPSPGLFLGSWEDMGKESCKAGVAWGIQEARQYHEFPLCTEVFQQCKHGYSHTSVYGLLPRNPISDSCPDEIFSLKAVRWFKIQKPIASWLFPLDARPLDSMFVTLSGWWGNRTSEMGVIPWGQKRCPELRYFCDSKSGSHVWLKPFLLVW